MTSSSAFSCAACQPQIVTAITGSLTWGRFCRRWLRRRDRACTASASAPATTAKVAADFRASIIDPQVVVAWRFPSARRKERAQRPDDNVDLVYLSQEVWRFGEKMYASLFGRWNEDRGSGDAQACSSLTAWKRRWMVRTSTSVRESRETHRSVAERGRKH